MPLPLVAIVGATNAGKSTLFNRLVGRRRSIVTDEPGVTRDRIYGEVRDAPTPFRLVDTGGLAPGSQPLALEVESQVLAALEEATAVLFVVDVRAGVTALDLDIADMLRRRRQAVLVVANKVDSPSVHPMIHDLHELGLGPAIPVSAEHGLEIEELLGALAEILGAGEEEEPASGEESRSVRIAIVGRPNVGKSSLLNRLAGEDRAMVSDIPGTTRDAVDTLLEIGERRYLLVDTAGLRRRGKARLAAEALSVVLARKSIRRTDVVVLVVDATTEFAAQDAHIAGYASEAHKPIVVAANKWDLVDRRESEAKAWEERIRRGLPFAKKVPIILVSARTGQRVVKILDRVDEAYAAAGRRVTTPELNRWLQQVARSERASPARGRSVNLLYATQTGVHPPRFVLFCNDPGRVHFSLRRFLENSLRERFGFGASPIHLQFRRRTSARNR